MKTGSQPLKNHRHERFAHEFVANNNGTKAAIKAGYSEKSAYSTGSTILKNPKVKDRIAYLTAKALEPTGITAEEVLGRMVSIVRANPNELIQYRHGACRYCHGENSAKQYRNQQEFDIKLAEWMGLPKKKRENTILHPMPTDDGGFGYRRTLPINPDCEMCDGLGEQYTLPMDTRTLKGDAAFLLAGVKETQHGIEIKMHDQAAMLVNLARHFNLLGEKPETGDALNNLAAALVQINKKGSGLPITQPGDDQ